MDEPSDTPSNTPTELLLEIRRAKRQSTRSAAAGRLVALELLRAVPQIWYPPEAEDTIIRIASSAFASELKKLSAAHGRDLQRDADVLSTALAKERARYARLARAVFMFGIDGDAEALGKAVEIDAD